jgi:hypothetical protein
MFPIISFFLLLLTYNLKKLYPNLAVWRGEHNVNSNHEPENPLERSAEVSKSLYLYSFLPWATAS